jgi:outer membrane protein
MRNSRRAGLLAAVFSSALLFGASGMAHAETLAEAIALAYDTNPQILSQRSLLRNADELYYRTTRTLGPTVTADLTLGDSSIYLTNPSSFQRDFASSQQTSLAVTASQSIYTGGRLTANIRAQEANLLAQREALRSVEQAVLQSVVQAYVDINRSTQSLDIARQNVEVLTKARDEAKIRFEVGNNTRTDVAQADSRLSAAITSRISAEATLANAQATYAQVVGRAPGTLAKEPAIGNLLPTDVLVAFNTAQENNPALRSAYLQERQSAQQIVAAKSAYKPTVSASVSAGYVPDLFNQNNNGNITAAIRATVPLYTGLTTASTIRSAEETNNNDNINIERQRRAVQQQVTQAWNTLISARASIVSNRDAVTASELASQGTTEEQRVGLRTPLDVLNAEQEFRTAEQNLVNASANEYIAAVSLLNAMGKLSVDAFAQVPRYDPKIHFDKVNSFELPWEKLVREIDQIGVKPAAERKPGVNEIVPTFTAP